MSKESPHDSTIAQKQNPASSNVKIGGAKAKVVSDMKER